MEINVTKRDGRVEALNKDKILEAISYCSGGLDNVSPQAVFMNAKLQFFDCMNTSDIHKALVKSAADMITELSPDYQYVAGRLELMRLRKEVYGQWEPPSLYSIVVNLVEQGFYHNEILEKWSERDFEYFDKRINHNRDMDLSYAAISTFVDKYLVQDRISGQVFETPQVAYMVGAMTTFQDHPKSKRKDLVLRYYEAVSTQKLSLPSPIVAGVRTPQKQYSSCVLISAGDSLDSINAASSAVVKYVSQRAGIGLDVGRIRTLGSPIRKGQAFHTGLIPFVKHFQTAVKSCSQGGMRNGAGTVFYPLWRKDVESLLVLKNDKGSEDNRARHLDYAVQMNRLMYRKVVNNDQLNLFCPNDVPDLYDAFYRSNDEFEMLYEKYSMDTSIEKTVVKAMDLMMSLISERSSTGRLYIHNVDNTAEHGPFDPNKAPIRQSNLCLEVALPTTPLTSVEKDDGEIALCTLGALNLGNIDYEDLPEVCDIAVRAIDSLFDLQEYPLPAAEKAKYRRSIGVGVINYAYWLAKNGYKYSDPDANRATHELFEAIQFNLLNASAELAKESGACEYFEDTRYSQGLLPIDWYNKKVDSLCDNSLNLDWEGLRDKISKYGLRNSTLTALMPSETSSLVSTATNGIEPIRDYTVTKKSKARPVKMVYPEVDKLFDKYEKQWDIEGNKGYLEKVAIMQKFVDQAISVNANYNPFKSSNGMVSRKEVLKDILTHYQQGGKTMYYHNTYDGKGDDMVEEDGCSGGACKI